MSDTEAAKIAAGLTDKRLSIFGMPRNFCACGERIPVWRWRCGDCERRAQENL
jgi:hypothetical protein